MMSWFRDMLGFGVWWCEQTIAILEDIERRLPDGQ